MKVILRVCPTPSGSLSSVFQVDAQRRHVSSPPWQRVEGNDRTLTQPTFDLSATSEERHLEGEKQIHCRYPSSCCLLRSWLWANFWQKKNSRYPSWSDVSRQKVRSHTGCFVFLRQNHKLLSLSPLHPQVTIHDPNLPPYTPPHLQQKLGAVASEKVFSFDSVMPPDASQVRLKMVSKREQHSQ